jgi:hypothetical protein
VPFQQRLTTGAETPFDHRLGAWVDCAISPDGADGELCSITQIERAGQLDGGHAIAQNVRF